ncbi:hypothetical protein [Emticicia sp. BO119]|uniref:hypothetical protein n=1 Tax=Emticicia sp. BO119 TaxID=2757768 RepID=UPI0015F0E7AD|nr:hypothetical protein [Emticicia sp. BO119]MBA4853231.1 hypothetical protein [Emticicia sp. BO119]
MTLREFDALFKDSAKEAADRDAFDLKPEAQKFANDLETNVVPLGGVFLMGDHQTEPNKKYAYFLNADDNDSLDDTASIDPKHHVGVLFHDNDFLHWQKDSLTLFLLDKPDNIIAMDKNNNRQTYSVKDINDLLDKTALSTYTDGHR